MFVFVTEVNALHWSSGGCSDSRGDPHHRRTSRVGINVTKLKNAIAITESSREGETRFWSEVETLDTSMRRII